MGDGKNVVRKRATGTRQHVVAYLTEAGELYDKDGLASARLAAAVDYPGSSVAFAQLLSGMERSGLIVREVHGKRTYRIGLGDVEGYGPVSRAPARPEPAPAAAGFDYDELARRLLVQVVRRLAAEPSADQLAAENIRLREQLRAAQRSLAQARDQSRRLPVTSDLGNAEVIVLQRLLQQD